MSDMSIVKNALGQLRRELSGWKTLKEKSLPEKAEISSLIDENIKRLNAEIRLVELAIFRVSDDKAYCR